MEGETVRVEERVLGKSWEDVGGSRAPVMLGLVSPVSIVGAGVLQQIRKSSNVTDTTKPVQICSCTALEGCF